MHRIWLWVNLRTSHRAILASAFLRNDNELFASSIVSLRVGIRVQVHKKAAASSVLDLRLTKTSRIGYIRTEPAQDCGCRDICSMCFISSTEYKDRAIASYRTPWSRSTFPTNPQDNIKQHQISPHYLRCLNQPTTLSSLLRPVTLMSSTRSRFLILHRRKMKSSLRYGGNTGYQWAIIIPHCKLAWPFH